MENPVIEPQISGGNLARKNIACFQESILSGFRFLFDHLFLFPPKDLAYQDTNFVQHEKRPGHHNLR